MNNNGKKYLISQNKNAFIIRKELQKALTNLKFIEDIFGDSELFVKEVNHDTKEVIQTIKITNLDLDEVCGLWRVNLETEIAGISTKDYFKTPEIALLVLIKENEDNYHLDIILIELKSSLQDAKLKKSSNLKSKPKFQVSTLTDCEEKFENATNRLYLLLSLNEVRNHTTYQNKSISIDFKGVVFYKKSKIKKDDNTQLYQIFTGNSLDKKFMFKSILDSNEKIKIKFENRPEITLEELLKI